jgi:hypothetical protein
VARDVPGAGGVADEIRLRGEGCAPSAPEKATESEL